MRSRPASSGRLIGILLPAIVGVAVAVAVAVAVGLGVFFFYAPGGREPALPDRSEGVPGPAPLDRTEPTPQPSPEPGFDLEMVATGLDEPVYLTHAGDGSGRLFIVERTGKILVWRDGRLLEEPFVDLDPLIGTRGSEQGLLSLAFPPDFTRTGLVFVSYTARDGGSIIARYRVRTDDPDRLEPGSAVIVLRVDQPFQNHNGGLIKFGPDGYLYVGLGDGGGAGDPHGHGRNRRTLLGTILRLDVGTDRGYAIPPDNPFRDGDGRAEIWAFGLRNPWRFSFDRETGDLYIADVGQNRREEINVEPAGGGGGRNYGWNVWEGSLRFRADLEPPAAAVFPVAEYRIPRDGCAVTGGYVYRGKAVPTLRDIYVFGDFCSGTLRGLGRKDDSWRMIELLRTELRISSFGEDEEGELHVVDYRGAVYRLKTRRNSFPGGEGVRTPI